MRRGRCERKEQKRHGIKKREWEPRKENGGKEKER